MKKYAYTIALSLTGSFCILQAGEADLLFQKEVQKLQEVVKISYNPISTILNKSYRLPTQQEYHERLRTAIQFFHVTGKSRLMRETSVIGYQSSWLKKHRLLNTVVEAIKYSPAISFIAISSISAMAGSNALTAAIERTVAALPDLPPSLPYR